MKQPKWKQLKQFSCVCVVIHFLEQSCIARHKLSTNSQTQTKTSEQKNCSKRKCETKIKLKRSRIDIHREEKKHRPRRRHEKTLCMDSLLFFCVPCWLLPICGRSFYVLQCLRKGNDFASSNSCCRLKAT